MDMRMAFILGFTLGGVLNFYQFKTFVTEMKMVALFTSGAFFGSAGTLAVWKLIQ